MIDVGGQTSVHPIGLVALLLSLVIILLSRKEFVIPAILIFVFAIPSAQRIVLLSIDFSFLRITIIAALLRAVFNGEIKYLQSAKPDRIIFFWMVWGIISFGLLMGSLASMGTRAGYMVDAVGAYFVGRLYVKSWDDMRRITLFVGYASIPILFLFLYERSTGRNLFSAFGGISEYTLVRDGKLRCQGPFSHPIMAGLYWASALPWLAVVWYRGEASKFLLLVIISSVLVITLNTASSTPLMAALIFVTGLFFFRYRRQLPAFRWIALFLLLAAQIVMEKGVAHLLARANILSGSTGWHRYHLIDEAMNHIGEWFFVGTKSTAHWGAGLEDVTNQYVLEGVRGGLLGMILFVAFIYSLFRTVGIAIKSSDENRDRWVYWCSGVLIFMHVFSFLSASYFGQMVASFFIFSGMIVSIAINGSSQRHP